MAKYLVSTRTIKPDYLLMVTFDKFGNPQPGELINFPYTDFKVTFVDNFASSTTRQLIIEGYERFLADFKSEIISKFNNWVNGSFTTTKVDPNDIDLVNLVNHTEELNAKSHLLLKFLTQGGSKEAYMVDSYFVPVYPASDPRYVITEQWINYWLEWFGHDREKRKKAIVVLSIS